MCRLISNPRGKLKLNTGPHWSPQPESPTVLVQWSPHGTHAAESRILTARHHRAQFTLRSHGEASEQGPENPGGDQDQDQDSV